MPIHDPVLKGTVVKNGRHGCSRVLSMSRSTHTYVAVVDDDENLCRSSGRLLRAVGLFPVSYPWAEAFLPDTERPYFDCLVLDVRLGGMSGIELRPRLNEMGPTSPLFSTQLTLILWTRSAPRKSVVRRTYAKRSQENWS